MTAAAAGVRPGRRLSQLNFAVLALYWVAIGYLWQSLGTLIIPDAVQSMVGSASKGRALSLLEGIGALVAVTWQPVAGALSDRTRSRWGRRRPYIVVGTAGDLVFLAGLAAAGAFWPLVVFYTLLQLSSNSAQGPYQGLAPDVVPAVQRGTASGYYGLANLLGILLGTVVAGTILALAGRPAALASVAVLLLLAMLITVGGVREPEPPPREGAGPGRFGAIVRATFTTPLGHPDFLWLMGSRLLILMAVVGVQSFALFYFTDSFFRGDPGAATKATTVLVGIVILVAIGVTWPAAWLSDRTGRKPLIVVSGILATAGLLVMLFSGLRWLPSPLLEPLAAVLRVSPLVAQTLVAGVLLGAGLGVFLSVDWALITDVSPPDQAGLFFGFSNIATAGAGILARFAAGFVLDQFNAGGPILGLPGGYPVIFVMFISWLIVGTLLILKVRLGPRPAAAAAPA